MRARMEIPRSDIHVLSSSTEVHTNRNMAYRLISCKCLHLQSSNHIQRYDIMHTQKNRVTIIYHISCCRNIRRYRVYENCPIKASSTAMSKNTTTQHCIPFSGGYWGLWDRKDQDKISHANFVSKIKRFCSVPLICWSCLHIHCHPRLLHDVKILSYFIDLCACLCSWLMQVFIATLLYSLPQQQPNKKETWMRSLKSWSVSESS